MNNFFVYGTLKIGGRYSSNFDSIRKSSKKAILKYFDLYEVPKVKFPAIVPGNGSVIGELHEYDKHHIKQVIALMDKIEGYSEEYLEKDPKMNLYLRQIVQVELENGTKDIAYIYVYNRKINEKYKKIMSGKWVLT